MMKRLTDLAAARLAPVPGKRLERFDGPGGVAGLSLRISARGIRSWSLMVRVGTRQRRLTLGRFPDLSLADARKRARAALELAERGIDPAGDRVERRPDRDLFANVVAQYLELHARPNRLRRAADLERLLRHSVLPHWGKRRIQEIGRRDVLDLIDRIKVRAPSMAVKVQASVGRVFNWALERGIIAASPLAGMKRPVREQARERVLEPHELAAVWRGAEAIGWPYGPIVKLLILTGARRSEVTGMAWSELDLERRLWIKPAVRVKSGREHRLPLSPAAVDLLGSLPRVDGSDFVFPNRTGTGPVQQLSDAKVRFDRLCGVSGWRLHDLRRTCASMLAELGVRESVIAAILDHSQAGLFGVTARYNRHKYEAEARAALERWAGHLARLAEGGGALVVKIA
jgi:integrase